MAQTKYRNAQRAEALELYVEHGPAEASRRTSIPRATISQWARRAGVTVTRRQRTAAATETARLTWGQRRADLAVRLGEVASDLLERIHDAEPGEARALARPLELCIEKAELLSGGVTSRNEQVSSSDIDREIEDLVAQVRSQAQAEALNET
jgi:hypothetical protein